MYYMLLIQMKGEDSPEWYCEAGEPVSWLEEKHALRAARDVLRGEGNLPENLLYAYDPWPGVEWVKFVECREVEPAIFGILDPRLQGLD